MVGGGGGCGWVVGEEGGIEKSSHLLDARLLGCALCLSMCALGRRRGKEGRKEEGGGCLLSESTASLLKEAPLIVFMRLRACPRLSAYTCMYLPCAGGRQRQRASDACQDAHVSLSGCVEWRSRRQ